jgi:cobalt-precorrin 5A hydrolase
MGKFLREVFSRHALSLAAIACLASLEAKRDEQGLRELAQDLGVPVEFFPAEALGSVAVPNPSARVEEHMGTASVCEAAAILAAGGGRLLVGKQKTPDLTLAVARLSPPASSG